MDVRTVSIVMPDGSTFGGQAIMTCGPREDGDGMVTYEATWQPTEDWKRVRPSTAKFKRELRDRATPKRRRMDLWNFLQYRRRHG